MADSEKQKQAQLLIDSMKELQSQYRKNADTEKEIAQLTELRSERQQVINDLQRDYNELSDKQKKILTELLKIQNDENKQLKEITKQQKELNDQLSREKKLRQDIVDKVRYYNSVLKTGWEYLQQSDKVIRNTILNLGMTGAKAKDMRTAFEQSAGYVTRLGGDLADIQGVMEGYADETGRARVMSAEMVKDITAIGKGTGLGIEQAAKLGAQFELMGFDAKGTMEYVQGVVDTTERMGVNTTKVLKNVNDNFKRLNTYTFQQGVKGFAQMAAYAEKFRIDIGQALNAADISRTLEGAIDLAANLQIMGGEFAKTDPFEMLFLSRNDPAKFTEKIADMTKGVVTFRKMSDGSFEKFISPADRDRLAAVAKSLGMEASELTQIAERQADIQRMRQQMGGMGLSDKEKELIEGAANFNKETGRFEVQLAGRMLDVTKLTKAQAASFAKQTVSLEERAKQAQTFDDTFKATINSLKAALLPVLHAVNKALDFIRPIADGLGKIAGSSGGWIKAGGLFLSAAIAMKIASKGFSNWLETGSVMNKPGAGGKPFGGFFSKSPVETAPTGRRRSPVRGKAGGKFGAGAGAGVGAAAAGVGVGIGAAAAGISLLADSMSKLDEKQAKTLKSIVLTLGLSIGITALAAVGILAFGTAAGSVAVPLIAFGGAVALIGAGIGIAAAGIGVMGMGLAKLVTASKDAGTDLPKVAAGVGEIAGAMALAGATMGGGIGMAIAISSIAKHSDKLATVGTSLALIKTSLSGSKEDFLAVREAIDSISKMNIKGGGALADLANMMRKPLKVEFADKKLAMVNDITLNIDGDKFMRKVVKMNTLVQRQYDLAQNKAEQ